MLADENQSRPDLHPCFFLSKRKETQGCGTKTAPALTFTSFVLKLLTSTSPFLFPTQPPIPSSIMKRHFRIPEGNVPNALARKKKNRKNWSDRYLNYFILLPCNSWEYNDIPLFIIHSTMRFRTTPNYSFLWIFNLYLGVKRRNIHS